ncbi:MAG: zinc ABC transporter substrate-binding protein [Bacteroidota bacterium]
MRSYKNWIVGRIGVLWVVLLMVTGCQPEADATSEASADQKLKVVATTGMIADAAKEIGGELVEVTGMMGPGVDPHLYKATRSDLTLLREADIIFYNGLHLEGKMAEVLEKLGRQKPVFAIAEKIPEADLLLVDGATNSHDPHIWFDVSLWAKAVQEIGDRLAELDPKHASAYQQQIESYLRELVALHQEVGEQLSTVPPEQRVLITAHDAFGYFGKAYGVEVRGLQGISTVAEFGLKDIKELVDFIVSKQIKAVFVESSIPTKSLEAVVEGCKRQGHGLRIGGTLYSDAMGAPDGPAGTYIGMVRENVRTISEALK